MNSKVHPLVVLIVVVLTVLVIGLWVWGTGRAKQIAGPAELAIDPAGHLYLQMQNYLLEHDSAGRFVKRHDLSKLGIERVLGTIRFFSNGDILLRRGVDSRTLLDNIRAYLRLSNEKPLRSDFPGTGIYRCNLRTDSCSPFGPELIDFTATFGLFIDWETDDVFFSDTTRHALRKYSAEGESLGMAKGDFRFPNQLLVRDGLLYVANTNRHSVQIVEPASDSFGTTIDSINVISTEASSSGHKWPSHLARIGDEWWINNMSTDMDDGGIYVFDTEWHFRYRVALPSGADPISIVPFGDEVLVSDWNNDRVHRISIGGQLLGDFTSPGLQDLVAESVTQRLHFKVYAYVAVLVYFLLIIALIFKGIISESTEQTKAKTRSRKTSTEFPDELVWIEPDPKVVRKIKLSVRLAALCVVPILPIFVYLMVIADQPLAIAQLILPVIGIVIIFVMIVRLNHININTAIGLRGKNVTLRNHTGQKITVPAKDIFYDRTTIASAEIAVFLGQARMAIYDREILDNEVFPRLGDAKSVSALEMQMALIRMHHPQGLITLLAILAFSGAGIWMLIKNLI